LKKVLRIMRAFEEVEVERIPQSKNLRANALSKLASSTMMDM